MSKTVDAFIALIRSAVTETNEIIELGDVDLRSLYSLAKFHDMAHIVYYELKRRNIICEDEIARKFQGQLDLAAYRHIKRDLAIANIRGVFENARIPFILLKGAFIMNLYPEAWMRTSSDIDILVKPEDHKKAVEALKSFGMRFVSESLHDASFFTQEEYHVELHHTLIEGNRLPGTTELLELVWQHTTPIENRFEHLLNDEMLYLYHLAHMAKHIKNGGCGVRFFLDLWLLDHKIDFDPEKRESLIKKSGLSEFALQSEKLSEKWFSVKCEQSVMSVFENYIIYGGIYGSIGNSVAIRKNTTGNRFLYYLQRIFLPYGKIKYTYPVLQKWPVLLPFYWVKRWFGLLDPVKRKHAVNEVKTESATDKESALRVENLMKQLKI